MLVKIRIVSDLTLSFCSRSNFIHNISSLPLCENTDFRINLAFEFHCKYQRNPRVTDATWGCKSGERGEGEEGVARQDTLRQVLIYEQNLE